MTTASTWVPRNLRHGLSYSKFYKAFYGMKQTGLKSKNGVFKILKKLQ